MNPSNLAHLLLQAILLLVFLPIFGFLVKIARYKVCDTKYLKNVFQATLSLTLAQIFVSMINQNAIKLSPFLLYLPVFLLIGLINLLALKKFINFLRRLR